MLYLISLPPSSLQEQYKEIQKTGLNVEAHQQASLSFNQTESEDRIMKESVFLCDCLQIGASSAGLSSKLLFLFSFLCMKNVI